LIYRFQKITLKTTIRILIWGTIIYGIVFCWRMFTGAFGDVVFEGHQQSYVEYRTADKLPVFDPVGASEISHRMVSNIDTSDRWFMFTISESDFEALMVQLAANASVPTPMQWTPDIHPPQNWKPRHEPPSWWQPEKLSQSSRSVSWCYPADKSQPDVNHHGWFFLHEISSNRVYCWHWRYQWAGEMCK
jgi:hypothetical protein